MKFDKRGLSMGIIIIFLISSFFFSDKAWGMTEIPTWGAETLVWITYAPSYWGSPKSIYDHQGGPFDFQAWSFGFDNHGVGESSSRLQGSGIMPVLKAKSYVNDNWWGTWSDALAIEGYYYSGTENSKITLAANLSGYVNNPYLGISDNSTVLEALVYVFREENFNYCTDLGTLIYEYGAIPKASITFEVSKTGNVNLSGSVTFDVGPEETFYLWTFLMARAQWAPSYVDAFSTLTLSFDNPAGLTPKSVVPLPGTLILFSSGLLGFSAIGRKRILRKMAG